MQGELENATIHYRHALHLLNHSDWKRRASVYESLANIAFLQVNPQKKGVGGADRWHVNTLLPDEGLGGIGSRGTFILIRI